MTFAAVRLAQPKPERRSAKPPKPIRRKAKAGSRTSRRRKARKARCQDADRLFSEFIRTRDDWQCRACGKTTAQAVMQCAHVVSRRYRAVRWNPHNAVCLCSGCHVKFTHDPLGWDAWCEERFPDSFAAMKTLARIGVEHIDYELECHMLRERLAELKERRA